MVAGMGYQTGDSTALFISLNALPVYQPPGGTSSRFVRTANLIRRPDWLPFHDWTARPKRKTTDVLKFERIQSRRRVAVKAMRPPTRRRSRGRKTVEK